MQLIEYVKSLKGQRVTVLTKQATKFTGTLKFVDRQMNIILGQATQLDVENGEDEQLGEVVVRGSAIRTIQADCDCQQKLSKLLKA